MWAKGYTRAEATEAAETRWTDHVTKMYAMMLMRKAKSWFTGYNSNVPGHEQGTIRYLVYNGGAPKYVNAINAVAANGYEGVTLGAPVARLVFRTASSGSLMIERIHCAMSERNAVQTDHPRSRLMRDAMSRCRSWSPAKRSIRCVAPASA